MIPILEGRYPTRLYRWMNSNGKDLDVVYDSGDIELSSDSLDFEDFSEFGTIDDFTGSLTISRDEDAVDVINACLEKLGLDVRITLDELRKKIKNTYW